MPYFVLSNFGGHMKNKKMVITTTYSVLSVLWGIALLGIVATVFSIILGFFVEIPSTLDISANIMFKGEQVVHEITEKISAEPFHLSSQFTTSGYINKPTVVQKILSSLYNLLWILSVYYSIHLIRRVLKTIYKDNEFTERNVQDIKNLAKIILFVPLVLTVLRYLYTASVIGFSFTGRQITFENFNITLVNSFGSNFFVYAVFGGLIYIVAAAFDYGKNLKQENDLTV